MRVHESGNNKVNPYPKISHQEMRVMRFVSIATNCVDTLSNSVHATIEIKQLPMITRDSRRFFFDKEPERITGSTGKTHGAKMVKIPAKKASQ
jgi:hypothetical protein